MNSSSYSLRDYIYDVCYLRCYYKYTRLTLASVLILVTLDNSYLFISNMNMVVSEFDNDKEDDEDKYIYYSSYYEVNEYY